MDKAAYREKVYKYKIGSDQVKSEATYGYVCESIEINNGIYTHIQGMEYPEKGVASTEDIFAVNAVKKMIIESLSLAKYFIPSFIIFAFLPFKYKLKIANHFMFAFRELSFRIMSPYIIQYHHLTPMAKELHIFLTTFFNDLGINTHVDLVIEVIVNIINFDNAYRYRIQDLFNETTKERLQRPYSEFRRLLELNRQRETSYPKVNLKFKLFGRAIGLIMFHPRVKRAYLKALDSIAIEKIKPDAADRFWMCIRTNYNYFGKTDKERMMLINHLKYVIPTKIGV